MNSGSTYRSWSKALLVGCALVLGVLSAGRLTPAAFSGYELNQVIEGDFSSDGWVGEQATVEVQGFSSLINSLRLRFNAVRPGATEVARVTIAACDEPAREFTLEGEVAIRIGLPVGCSPARVTIRSLNLFTPLDEKTPRQLGVQLKEVKVSSPLGFAVATPGILLGVSALWVALALLTQRVAASAGIPGLASGYGALVAGVALLLSTGFSAEKLEPVAAVVIAGLFGMTLYSSGSRRSSTSQTNGGGTSLLIVALAVGIALRLYGISFGLPSNFHPDEVPKVNAIMRMVDQGLLDPQYFLHPSLLLYLTYGMNTLLHALGLADGSFRDSAFLAGRLVSTTAGVISIAVTYAIGKRLFSPVAAGSAALLLAVLPLHVTCSRYLKEDALLTCITLQCVYVTIWAVQSQRRWMLLIAGLLAGCTAGAKYSGILMVVVPASAPWIASRRLKPDMSWLPWAFAAGVIAPLGFLATTPYAVLNSAKFLKDFQSESRHMQTGHTVSITAWSQLWMYHFWRSIWPGVTALVALAGAVALGFLVRRARVEDLLVVGLTLLFYLPAEYVKAKPAPQPERYILPCLPFIALAVGELVRHVRTTVTTTGVSRFIAPIVGVSLVIFPLIRSAYLARDLSYDTRDQLASWMKANIPEGSKVLMDWKPYCPNFHGEFFQVEHIPRARIIPELDVQSLRTSGANYLVLSSLFYNRYFSQPESQPVLRQRFREVFQRVPVVIQFEAPSGTYGFHNPTLTLFSLSEEDFKRLDQERVQKMQGEIDRTSNEVRAQAKW